MQFGRFHGIALLALGGLMLLVQIFVIFSGSSKETRPLPEQTSTSEGKPVEQKPRTIDYLPGVLGVVLVGLGGYTLVLRQKNATDRAEEQSAGQRTVRG